MRIMPSLYCLWARQRIERLADGALRGWTERTVTAHCGRCERCRAELDRALGLKAGVHRAALVPRDPDWSRFWPGIQARLLREKPKPIRESWWLPIWKPVWGHPRLAFGSALLAVLIVGFSLWPVDDAAFASSVTVQDVSQDDADRSVMVYSSRASGVTVIWVFAPSQDSEVESDEP